MHTHTHRDPLFAAVTRTAEGQASSPARLLVGSLHDDALLLCRALALEQFPSPLVLRCQTRTPVKGRGKAIEASRAAAGGSVPSRTRVKPVRCPGNLQGPTPGRLLHAWVPVRRCFAISAQTSFNFLTPCCLSWWPLSCTSAWWAWTLQSAPWCPQEWSCMGSASSLHPPGRRLRAAPRTQPTQALSRQQMRAWSSALKRRRALRHCRQSAPLSRACCWMARQTRCGSCSAGRAARILHQGLQRCRLLLRHRRCSWPARLLRMLQLIPLPDRSSAPHPIQCSGRCSPS